MTTEFFRSVGLPVILAVSLLLAACGGGGGGSGNGGNGGGNGGSGGQGQDVSVSTNYTGPSLNRSASQTGSDYYGSLRLIDPDEDVLIGEFDSSNDSTFVFENVDVQPVYELEYDFTVPQDLQTGELDGTTDVKLTVPLSVESGGDTSVSTDMSISEESGTTTMLASYTVQTPESTRNKLIEVDFQTGTVTEDLDGDGNFQNDPSFTDSDRDGLDDDTEDALPEAARQQGTGEIEEEGVIVQSLNSQNFSSITAGNRTWQINGLTDVIDRRGDEDEAVTRAALATGQTVDIKGFARAAAAPLATRIRIEDGEDSGGFGGRREVEVDEVTLQTVNLQQDFVIADGQRWELREATTVEDERESSESENAPFSRLEQGLLVDIKGWITGEQDTHIARRIRIEDDQQGDDDSGDDDSPGNGDDDDDGDDDDNPGQGDDNPGNGDDNPGQGDDDSGDDDDSGQNDDGSDEGDDGGSDDDSDDGDDEGNSDDNPGQGDDQDGDDDSGSNDDDDPDNGDDGDSGDDSDDGDSDDDDGSDDSDSDSGS